ncbi:MAG: MFS transporter [Bacteroidota bacterium]
MTSAPRRPLPVLFLGVLMAALDIAIVAPALPALREAFGVDERAIAWVFNAFVLCNLAGLPVMAKLSDRYGRRRIYLFNVTVFALGALVVAQSSTFEGLLMGRAVQGLGASGIFPVASAVVGDVYPPEQLGRAVGIIGAVFGLAFIIGPILSGILLSVASWPWLFYVPLPLAVLVFVLGLRLLPQRVQAVPAKLDLQGLVVLSALLALLAYGLNQLDASQLGTSLVSVEVGPFLLGALALGPLFLWVEGRAEDPVLRLNLLRNRQVLLACSLAIGAGLTEASFVFLSAYAVAAYAVSTSTASYMLLPLVIAVAVGSPVAGRLIDRVGSRWIVLGGVALLTAGLFIMAVGAPAGTALFYIASVLIGLGLSTLLGSALSYILLNESRGTERTVAQGITTLFISVGQLIGAALIGAIAASTGGGVDGFAQAFLVMAGVTSVLMLAAYGLKRQADELATARANQ